MKRYGRMQARWLRWIAIRWETKPYRTFFVIYGLSFSPMIARYLINRQRPESVGYSITDYSTSSKTGNAGGLFRDA